MVLRYYVQVNVHKRGLFFPVCTSVHCTLPNTCHIHEKRVATLIDRVVEDTVSTRRCRGKNEAGLLERSENESRSSGMPSYLYVRSTYEIRVALFRENCKIQNSEIAIGDITVLLLRTWQK